MRNDYDDFVDAYAIGASRLVEAASQGYRRDPSRYLPQLSFVPTGIEETLRAAEGFNPEAEFPARCFPRAWPFVGGQLVPAPPAPPTRELVIEEIEGTPTIVWRGEIPTVRVPRRRDGVQPQDSPSTAPCTDRTPKEELRASRDPSRDPP